MAKQTVGHPPPPPTTRQYINLSNKGNIKECAKENPLGRYFIRYPGAT